MEDTLSLESKLPDVGTTIFSVMSALAQEHNALNLSQGFPDFPVSPELIDRIHYWMKQGANQYAPMPGLPALRQQIAKKCSDAYNHHFDADQHITVTPGGTAALYAAIAAVIRQGEEVIVIEPAYDSYAPAIRLNGGIPVPIGLRKSDFKVDWQKVEAAITDNTRMIIINTPHNPTGSILQLEDLEQLASLVRGKDIFILSDEVYEHIIFDGEPHQSVLAHAELREKSMAVFSFGKTFHATGWKTGYVVAPAYLTKEIRKVHQFMVFSVNTPLQFALADYLQEPKNYQSLPAFYQQKRDLFQQLVKPSRFQIVPCKGTYFQLLSYKQISDLPDTEMAEWLTKEHKLASIPISVFFSDKRQDSVLRFCFAKSDETLQKAAEILCKI
ncbi:methionine aminotransferase [Peijinzhouia sedimentorum]